jgi:uncharacterized protein with HEPN domain
VHNSAVILDIHQAIILIFKYTENVTYQQLEQNQEKQDAILRRITIDNHYLTWSL